MKAHAALLPALLLVGVVAAPPQISAALGAGEKKAAIAELTKAGFMWDESSRRLEITDAARPAFRDLSAIQAALEALQPSELDLTSCPVLENVDGLRRLRGLRVVNLSECPVLKSADGIPTLPTLKKVYLHLCPSVSTESLESIQRRLPKAYLVLPDGTGLNPPRER